MTEETIVTVYRVLLRAHQDYVNLLAAARATLIADADGEPDPLYYLRDELGSLGHLPHGFSPGSRFGND